MSIEPINIECPCGAVIPVPVEVTLSPLSPVGQQRLIFDPDMTDLWAHTFTHDGGPGDGIPLAGAA